MVKNSFHFWKIWGLNAKIGCGHATSKEVASMIDAFIAFVSLKSNLFTTASILKLIFDVIETFLYFLMEIIIRRIPSKSKTFIHVSKKSL